MKSCMSMPMLIRSRRVEPARDGLVEVRFTGGPLDGRAVFMCDPERRMSMELLDGRALAYVRHSQRVEAIAGEPVRVVEYVVGDE